MKMKRIAAAILMIILLFAASASAAKKKPAIELAPNTLYEVRIERVVDGDTVIVRFSQNERERVRLLGINTPESVHPNKPIEYYGIEASNYAKHTLTGGRTVFLQTDVGVRDRYQRALAYLWLDRPDDHTSEAEIREKMFNTHILLEGYGQVMTIQPNSAYADLFVKFQREAAEAGRGLWGSK